MFLDTFSCMKINAFRPFFAFKLKMHVRCDNQYKTGAEGELFWKSRWCLSAWESCVLSPACECEMRCFLVYLLIVNYLLILFKFSHSVSDWTFCRGIFERFLKTFLEGSVDHIIYMDNTVNRSSFIYCSLATERQSSATTIAVIGS